MIPPGPLSRLNIYAPDITSGSMACTSDMSISGVSKTIRYNYFMFCPFEGLICAPCWNGDSVCELQGARTSGYYKVVARGTIYKDDFCIRVVDSHPFVMS